MPQSDQSKNPVNRIHWIDHLKAFAIFLVVYGHSNSTEWGIDKWIYAFHMPLFFMVSGYLIRESALVLPTCAFIKKTLYAYLPPYLFFSIAGFLTWLVIGRQLEVDPLIEMPAYYPLAAIFYGTGSPEMFHVKPVVLWFFPCLIVAQIMAHQLFRLQKGYTLLLSAGLCILGLQLDHHVILPFEFEAALVAQSFIALGIVARRSKVISSARRPTLIWGGLALLILGSCIAWINGSVDLRHSRYSNPFYYMLSAFSLSLAFAFLLRMLPATKLSAHIAKHTILIFPTHMILFAGLSLIYVEFLQLDLSVRENPYVGFVAALIIILVITAVAPIIRKWLPWAYGMKAPKESNPELSPIHS